MRKLTPQEQHWVETAYPLVEKIMESYNLSENDTIDWHGELSAALCEAAIEISYTADQYSSGFILKWSMYARKHLEDCVHKIFELKQSCVKEFSSGLRPRKAAGRRHSL